MKALYKPIPSLESISLHVLKQENREFEYPWHYHPEYELTYVLTNPGVRYVGNSMENFSENDLVLLGPNLPHCWINHGNHGPYSSAVVIYWKQEFVDHGLLRTREFDAIRQLMKLSRKGVKYSASIARRLREDFVRLPALPPFERLILFVRLLNQLAHAEQDVLCEHGFDHSLNGIDSERINKVYQYIRTHYQQKISLSAIGEELGMSGEYFSRFFSKTMKKSFFEFLNEYKINVACRLLIETDRQVAEVCYASGYESSTFFYRQFRKFKQLPPQEYRLRYRKASRPPSDHPQASVLGIDKPGSPESPVDIPPGQRI